MTKRSTLAASGRTKRKAIPAAEAWSPETKFGWAIVALAVVFSYFSLQTFMRPVTASEPDGFFGLALARQTANEGLVTKVPQLKDLGWDQSFPEKNFLFTELGGLAYKIGGEDAARALTPLLALVILGLIFWLILPYCRTPLEGAAIFAVLLSTAIFVNRLVTFRPHLIAMVAFLCILQGLLSRRPWLAALGGFLFTNGYHFVYLPLALLAIAFAVEWRFGQRWRKEIYWALGGLAAGLVLNPHVPENIIAEFRTLRIALNSQSIDESQRAVEMMPPVGKFFLRLYGVYLVGLFASLLELAGFLFAGKVRANSARRDEATAWLLTLAATFFFALSLVNPRALEYAVPLGAICLASLLGRLPRPAGVVTAVVAIAALHSTLAYEFLRQPPDPLINPQWLTDALKYIPAANQDKKVYNCEWAAGSQIFYQRPDLNLVDLSDPQLFAENNPVGFKVREGLRNGTIAYPYGTIKFGFNSDYVLCRNPTVVSQLENDPHFKRLYPKILLPNYPVGFPYLYELAAEPRPNLVFDYEATTGSAKDPSARPPAHWTEVTFVAQKYLKANQRSPYIDLYRWLGSDPKLARQVSSDERVCAWIRPSAGAVAAHLGAQWLAVGGGPEVRTYFNGQPLYYAAGWQRTVPRVTYNYVPLPRALAAHDRVESLVCARPDADYLGFGLAFWKSDDLREVCRTKGIIKDPIEKEFGRWAYWGELPKTCLGQTAAADVTRSLAARPRSSSLND